jgi:hypothetical protein
MPPATTTSTAGAKRAASASPAAREKAGARQNAVNAAVAPVPGASPLAAHDDKRAREGLPDMDDIAMAAQDTLSNPQNALDCMSGEETGGTNEHADPSQIPSL